MPHTDAIVVLTTVASADEAVKLVRTLLERRLIACGTVLPGRAVAVPLAGQDRRRAGGGRPAEDALGAPGDAQARVRGAASVQGARAARPAGRPAGNAKYLEWINGETTLSLA